MEPFRVPIVQEGLVAPNQLLWMLSFPLFIPMLAMRDWFVE